MPCTFRIFVLIAFVLSSPATGSAQDKSIKPENKDASRNSDTTIQLTFPIIPAYGGVVARPSAVDQPRAGAKVVLDATIDGKPGEVNKAYERVARLLNLYGAAGLKATDVKIALVLHGETTKTVLNDK